VKVYKNVERIADKVFRSFHDGETEYRIGDTIESDTGIYVYLTKELADRGAFADEKKSYQIELVIDSLDEVRISKKKQHYVPRAKFTKVIKANMGWQKYRDKRSVRCIGCGLVFERYDRRVEVLSDPLLCECINCKGASK